MAEINEKELETLRKLKAARDRANKNYRAKNKNFSVVLPNQQAEELEKVAAARGYQSAALMLKSIALEMLREVPEGKPLPDPAPDGVQISAPWFEAPEK